MIIHGVKIGVTGRYLLGGGDLLSFIIIERKKRKIREGLTGMFDPFIEKMGNVHRGLGVGESKS
jgi:hypothetical protein